MEVRAINHDFTTALNEKVGEDRPGSGSDANVPEQAIKDNVLGHIDSLRANVQQFLTPRTEKTEGLPAPDSFLRYLLIVIETLLNLIQKVQREDSPFDVAKQEEVA